MEVLFFGAFFGFYMFILWCCIKPEIEVDDEGYYVLHYSNPFCIYCRDWVRLPFKKKNKQ